jgi:hypothetical protein
MKLTITSIELKGVFKFFILSKHALSIMRQLKTTQCKGFKKRGIWTIHYTMTLWNNEQEMKAFAMSGAHLSAMKISQSIAKEIKILTIDGNEFPKWKDAIHKLNTEGKTLRYN